MEIKIEKIDLYQRGSMRIDKIASSAHIEGTNNFKIANFWSQILVFLIETIYNLLIFQFR